jgi:hypothetical protein
MFWSHENQEPAESIGRYMREELRLRLRVAADFATLGAYELLEEETGPVERVVTEAPPKRVLLFAKVAPVCPHSAPVGPACKQRPVAPRRPRARQAARQRGGSVRAHEQPCLCSDERRTDV